MLDELKKQRFDIQVMLDNDYKLVHKIKDPKALAVHKALIHAREQYFDKLNGMIAEKELEMAQA